MSKVVYSVTCLGGRVRASDWFLRLHGPDGVASRRFMGTEEPGKADQRVAALELLAAERIRVADAATAALEALDVLEAELRG